MQQGIYLNALLLNSEIIKLFLKQFGTKLRKKAKFHLLTLLHIQKLL